MQPNCNIPVQQVRRIIPTVGDLRNENTIGHSTLYFQLYVHIRINKRIHTRMNNIFGVKIMVIQYALVSHAVVDNLYFLEFT